MPREHSTTGDVPSGCIIFYAWSPEDIARPLSDADELLPYYEALFKRKNWSLEIEVGLEIIWGFDSFFCLKVNYTSWQITDTAYTSCRSLPHVEKSFPGRR